jgi:peptidyl-prolyl cis-trans isomerase A (cyclophilin A)
MLCALLLIASYLLDPAPPDFRVKVDTSQGTFVIAVHREWAPNGADRFYDLVRAGYYDDSRFHRVVPGYIAQFGIAGEPKVSAAWRHRNVPADPEHGSNTRGTVGFAMVTPDARTTQVYINLADNRKRIDGQGFAILGEVVSGMDVVDRLYSGYGETSGGGLRAGKQDRLFESGNAYLDEAFPKLDKLIRATIASPDR